MAKINKQINSRILKKIKKKIMRRKKIDDFVKFIY